VDVLVNNAGVIESTLQPWWAMRPDEARSILNVNTIGPVLVTAALLPALRAGQRKLVANISSECGYHFGGGKDCMHAPFWPTCCRNVLSGASA
jgi:NADP-dependent 3-hydroxy acid dehydrogenase YdfG